MNCTKEYLILFSTEEYIQICPKFKIWTFPFKTWQALKIFQMYELH